MVLSTAYTPSAMSQAFDLSMVSQTEESAADEGKTPRERLNLYLASRDISPVRTSIMGYSRRTDKKALHTES
jgi:hypothetical protein